uniref:Protein Abitram n=1 Tax=Strigamia maritima TaxID=126957 RepID=T1JEP8_STRMM
MDVNTYLTVGERYYTPSYKTDIKGKENHDQCLLFHSNRICVICIAPTHPLIAENKSIEKVNFQVTEKVNRLENKVSGKSKKGGQWLTEDSPLCNVTCSDGSQYTICSCIKGKLIEVNEKLVSSPHLIIEKPQAEGYIGIVLTPKIGTGQKPQVKLLTADEYMQARKLEKIVKTPTN